MRRKDREIESREEVINVLKRCNTVSVGFQGQEYPYVVPVSFGVVQKDGVLTLYFHGAPKGLKNDMLEKNPKVCVQGHIFYRTEPTPRGITTRYESVIGFGVAQKADGDEAVVGLRSITEHYGYPGYSVEQCRGLAATAVYKITIEQLTGKRNLPE